ncbi:MAG TPA: sugar ABC transporter substrate-binding protein [Galbitalea sp.]|jgi:ABC-type sugar transport system substrate-binding protein|nr:sugar ABC transporter substrate-binding protein [Galbitalea sp.]
MTSKNALVGGGTVLRRARRKTILAGVLVAALAVLTACAGTPASAPTPAKTTATQQHKPFRLGFSPLSLDIPELQSTATALTKAGKAQGITVSVADPKFSPQTQVQQLMQWINLKQVDAIWVVPVAPPAIVPVIAAAQAAKIPVLVDATAQSLGMKGPEAGLSFSATDFAAFGKDLGDVTNACIASRLGGSGKIIYLKDTTGHAGGPVMDAKLNATIASGSPSSSIVSTIAPASQLLAQQQTQSALQGQPSANAAMSTNDEAALGALAAFQQAGKDPKKLCIIGGGGSPQGLADIKAGTLYGGVVFNFQEDTENNIREIATMVANPTATGRSLVIPIVVYQPKKK